MSRFDFGYLEPREWIECNGLGGWASASLSGALTRRYHGLLVAALRPPTGRMVMLSKLDEALLGAEGRFELGCNEYPGITYPRGFEQLAAFSRGLFPVFEFACGGMRLRKTVAALHGENTALVCYELLEASAPSALELRPLLAPRDYHSLSHANPFLRQSSEFKGGLLRLKPYDGVPEIFIQVPGSSFSAEGAWYRNFQYARERERGLDFEEDLFCHGAFRVELKKGEPLYVLASLQDPSGRDGSALLKAEAGRREALLAGQDDPFRRRLLLAADQFLVRRGGDLSTIIAGYPWFTDWSRDTMIALRGLCLSTGRLAEAKGILEAFLQSLSQGMLPNRFPDASEIPEYNTVDGTLWLFVAVFDFWKKGGDEAFVFKRCLPALLEILEWHRHGTRYGIQADADGLLKAGEPGMQLTWMDAKVGGWVVTPRQGKAVEVNALWFNALRISLELCLAAKKTELVAGLAREAESCRLAIAKAFWNPAADCCYDVIDGAQADASLRPNQLFCLSLPFPLFEGARAESILKAVEKKLLTPRGLRSLSPDDPRYSPRYEGGVRERDGAYHQGTVWGWLLGPYCEALIRVRGKAGKATAQKLIEGFSPHLDEACIGTASEIFDGEAPHAAKGCPAQAWTVAELLRIQLDFLSKD